MRIISPAELGTLKGVRFCNAYRLELRRPESFPGASSWAPAAMAISKMKSTAGSKSGVTAEGGMSDLKKEIEKLFEAAVTPEQRKELWAAFLECVYEVSDDEKRRKPPRHSP